MSFYVILFDEYISQDPLSSPCIGNIETLTVHISIKWTDKSSEYLPAPRTLPQSIKMIWTSVPPFTNMV